MDLNDLILSSEYPKEALQRAQSEATWLGAGQLYSGECRAALDFPLVACDSLLAYENPEDSHKLNILKEYVDIELPIIPELPSPKINKDYEKIGEAYHFEFGARAYRVLGLLENTRPSQLKVCLKLSLGSAFHLDTLDLYLVKSRRNFASIAALELSLESEVIRLDLGLLTQKLEALIEELSVENPANEVQYSMTESDREAASSLALDPNLLHILLEDLDDLGLVGELSGKLTAYLSCLSRKLSQPLGLIIQSTSAAGKSSLLDAILKFQPPEDVVKYSAMSGQSLFYMGSQSLKHKILAISEEEGVSRASYSLKLLQSDGELTMASTGKDLKTGRLITQEYRTEGPVMLAMTTTSIELDPELQNRFLVLSVDESSEQTRRIHHLQRESRSREAYVRRKKSLAKLHLWQNLSRLIEVLPVVNEFASSLTFVSDRTRTRRDQMKYLILMEAIALLFQKQGKLREDLDGLYVEVSLDDVELANALCNLALGRTLDELPPQTRNLLNILWKFSQLTCGKNQISQNEWRFSRREIREYCRWSDTQLRLHLGRLAEFELILIHRGARGQSYVYELLYHGESQGGHPFLMGLLDIEELRTLHPKAKYDGKFAGLIAQFTGLKRPQNGDFAGGENNHKSMELNVITEVSLKSSEFTYRDENKFNEDHTLVSGVL